jgi:prophage antirepressor-like protein
MQLDNFALFQDFLFKGEKPVSTLHVNGEIWFKGKQVAEILEYKEPQQALRKNIDQEDRKSLGDLKGVFSQTTPLTIEKNEQNQQVMINESGLYCLVLKSKKKEAVQFRKWITKEVIPSIRKTGKYENKELIEKIKQLENEKEQIQQKCNDIEIENKKLEEYYDDVSRANSKLNSTIDWYWEHDVTKTTDSFFQRLPPKKSNYIPANKKELIKREMQKNIIIKDCYEKCFRCHDIIIEETFTCEDCKELICEECAHKFGCKFLEDKKKPVNQRKNIKCNCPCNLCIKCEIKRTPNYNTLHHQNIQPNKYKEIITKDMFQLLNNPYEFKFCHYK